MKKILYAAAVAACVALSGCGEKANPKVHVPQPFGTHDRCILCGMVIVHYEGPKAEVFIKDAGDEAVKFCSGRDAFTFALQPENARRLEGFFIHDMAKTDWAKPDDRYLIDATKAVYVYGHDIDGVMGNEPAAFSDKGAAEKFVVEHGGAVYDYKAVTLELLEK